MDVMTDPKLDRCTSPVRPVPTVFVDESIPPALEKPQGWLQAPPPEQVLPPMALRAVARVLVGMGATLILFAAFQLWGTGLIERQAQRELAIEFGRLKTEQTRNVAPSNAVSAPRGHPTTVDSDATAFDLVRGHPDVEETNDVAMTAEPPPEGQPIGQLEIPAIGVSKTIVQGVQRDTLREGPGHYPGTPLPGQPGNAAIAGHRTTHGAPFYDLDQVSPGDIIEIETIDGRYSYEIQAQTSPEGDERGYLIVDPSDVSVIGDHGDNRLTLTACHPKFSARQRIVVTALLIGEPTASPFDPVIVDPAAFAAVDSPPPHPGGPASLDVEDDLNPAASAEVDPGGIAEVDPGSTVGVDPEGLDASLGWQMSELDPTVLWATVALLAAHAGWIFGRLWRPRIAYAMATPAVLLPLFVCFIHLDRLLPAY